MRRKYIITGAEVSQDKTAFSFVVGTQDQTALDPQKIIDALTDYLLIDPKELFQRPSERQQ